MLKNLNLVFRLKLLVLFIFVFLFGFGIGGLQSLGKNNLELELITQKNRPDISIVEFQKISGDELYLEILGSARLLWGEENLVENDGIYQIPIGQIKNENDLKLESFAYIGNAKTMKFYPSNSYPARGTAPEYRRYFQSKSEAIDNNFIPMKNMK